MNRLPVHVPRSVQEQILEQVLFIAEDSIDNALAWEQRLLSALNALGDMHGHAIDEGASERLGQTLRKVVFERTYLIHYRVDDAAGTVVVVNFRHGARLPTPHEP